MRMDIENFTSKLIMGYVKKIEDCDTLINPLRYENRMQRRGGIELERRESILAEIQTLEAKKQAYIQALADIESIQDHLGV
jgi:hypothetical protein